MLPLMLMQMLMLTLMLSKLVHIKQRQRAVSASDKIWHDGGCWVVLVCMLIVLL